MEKFLPLELINPNLKILQERYEEIYEEFKTNIHKIYLMNFGAESGYYIKNDIAYKGWKIAPLYGNIKDISQINGGLENFGNLVTVQDDLVKMTYNVNLLPKLTQALIDSGITKRVGISVVYPGKEIAWHSDPDPEKQGLAIIRGLWGLDVVEEEGKESFIYLKDENQKITFKNNEFVFFWGRTRHKVENNLSQPRFMVCFDHEVPYESILNS